MNKREQIESLGECCSEQYEINCENSGCNQTEFTECPDYSEYFYDSGWRYYKGVVFCNECYKKLKRKQSKKI